MEYTCCKSCSKYISRGGTGESLEESQQSLQGIHTECQEIERKQRSSYSCSIYKTRLEHGILMILGLNESTDLPWGGGGVVPSNLFSLSTTCAFVTVFCH